MNPNRSLRGRLRLGACAMLASAVVASPALSDEPAERRGTATFEIRFLEGMIDHHHMAVMMAELCEGRATHAELLNLCSQIRMTQMAEMHQMSSWLEDWYGRTYHPEMKPGMMRKIERLGELSGAEFEIEFMEMMIRHHEEAVREAGSCVEKAEHDELVALCETMHGAQEHEITQMRQWLCDWYERCRH